MSTQNLTQSQPNSNTPLLTPEVINKIAERSGMEPRFIRLWLTQLVTDFVTDQDGANLIRIWLNKLAEEGAK